MLPRSVFLETISGIYPGADPGDSRSWSPDVSGECMQLYCIYCTC